MAGTVYAKSIRKIDGEQYEDLLNDVATMEYYDNLLPCEHKPCMSGSRLWKSEKDYDPWERLVMAVISLAAQDYIRALVERSEWKQRELEGFFLGNEETHPVFRFLQMTLRKDRLALQQLERSVKVLW